MIPVIVNGYIAILSKYHTVVVRVRRRLASDTHVGRKYCVFTMHFVGDQDEFRGYITQ